MTLTSWLRRLITRPRGDGLRAGLIRDGLGSAGIQALNRILALAMGIVLARGLGAENYGTYAYVFAIMSLLMVVAEAGVPTLLMREVAVANGKQYWGLLRGALIRAIQFVMLASVSVTVLGLIVLWAIADHLSTAQYQTTMLMLLMLPLTAMARTTTSAMRGLHRVVVGQAVDALLGPLLVLISAGSLFLLVPAMRQPQYAMATQLAVAGIVLLVGGWMLRRFLPDASRSEPAEYRNRQWFKSMLPFMLIGGAGIVNNQTDIIMLGWFASATDVGVYRVAVQGSTMVVAFSMQIAGIVAAPHFARLYTQGEMGRLQHLTTASARVVFLASLPFALSFIIAGGTLAGWIFGDEFVASHRPLAVLSCAYLVSGAFGPIGSLLIMTGNENHAARILWQTALLNVALNGMFIPFYGAVGAAVASSISLIIWNVLLFVRVNKSIGISSFVWVPDKYRNKHES